MRRYLTEQDGSHLMDGLAKFMAACDVLLKYAEEGNVPPDDVVENMKHWRRCGRNDIASALHTHPETIMVLH